jgi:hypothetical protein
MAHWAKLDEDNYVVEVLVADDDAEGWLVENLGGVWVQTSYNTIGGVHYDPETREPSDDQSKAFRYNYASLGDYFDPSFGPDGAFIAKQPYGSWVLNPETALWEPPTAMPEEGGPYVWDDKIDDWKAVAPST